MYSWLQNKYLITCGLNIQTPNDFNRLIWGLNPATFEITINYSLYAKQKRKNHNSIFKEYIANCTHPELHILFLYDGIVVITRFSLFPNHFVMH